MGIRCMHPFYTLVNLFYQQMQSSISPCITDAKSFTPSQLLVMPPARSYHGACAGRAAWAGTSGACAGAACERRAGRMRTSGGEGSPYGDGRRPREDGRRLGERRQRNGMGAGSVGAWAAARAPRRLCAPPPSRAGRGGCERLDGSAHHLRCAPGGENGSGHHLRCALVGEKGRRQTAVAGRGRAATCGTLGQEHGR
ncbi:hypothetical protein GQ55_9G555900 [Panicum hallii var. hallii]|uniref:Uncharacterized protein n=1 Tax=Panicum hallii var. hallii TaxID=1504633 RepID=A0A2T7CFI8_9POAL|nr:hypothetical protein GQ55_9G555900 [Panicum hallii var. hallii]